MSISFKEKVFIPLIFFNAFLHETYINILFFKHEIIWTDYFETDPETHWYISSEKCCFCVAKGNSWKDDRASTEIVAHIQLRGWIQEIFFRKTQKERIDIVTIFYMMVWVSMPLRIWEIIGWILRGIHLVIWSSGSRKLVIKTEMFSFISQKSCPLVFW